MDYTEHDRTTPVAVAIMVSLAALLPWILALTALNLTYTWMLDERAGLAVSLILTALICAIGTSTSHRIVYASGIPCGEDVLAVVLMTALTALWTLAISAGCSVSAYGQADPVRFLRHLQDFATVPNTGPAPAIATVLMALSTAVMLAAWWRKAREVAAPGA